MKLLLPVFSFFLMAILSSVVGVDSAKSWQGNYFRSDGLFAFSHLIVLFIFLSVFFNHSWISPLVFTVAISTTLVSLGTLAEAFRLYVLKDITLAGWGGALGFTFGHPAYLNGFLMVTTPFLFYQIRISNRKYKWIWITFFILQIFAIFSTKSWAGLIILTLIFIFLLFKFFRKNFTNPKLIFFIFLVFTLLSIPVYMYKDREYRTKSFPYEGRERIVRKLLLSIRDRPILGWGWANVDYAFKNSVWPYPVDFDVYVDKAHSTLLEILTTMGFVGFTLYILLLWQAYHFFQIRISKEGQYSKFYETIFLSFLIYLFHSQTNIISINEELFFWMALGINNKDHGA